MQTPRHLMDKTGYIGERASSTEDTGAPQSTDTYAGATFKCAFQPLGGSEGFRMQREFGTTVYKVLADPVMSDGTSTVTALTHEKTIQIDSVAYRLTGDAVDLCSKGAVVRFMVEKLR